MASVFEARFAARALPKLMAHFGHDVEFILDDLSELRFSAMVTIDQASSTGEDPVEVDGRLSIKTEDLSQRAPEDHVLKIVRFKNQLYDVYSRSTDHCGVTRFNIRLKIGEVRHSNLYDISGNQAQWINNDA